MFAIRSTPRVAAIAAAAAASGCLMLSGCGGGSGGGSTGSAAGGSSAGSSPTASSAASVPGLPSAKLTGHFCADFTNISRNLPKVPAEDRHNLSALQAHGGQFFKSAAAYFNGLAGEAPPQAAAELKIIASAYSSLGSGSISASSVGELEKQMEGITTKGKTGEAFIGLVTYIATHCH
jgi:hypothetical protein